MAYPATETNPTTAVGISNGILVKIDPQTPSMPRFLPAERIRKAKQRIAIIREPSPIAYIQNLKTYNR